MVNFTNEKDGDLNATYYVGVFSISDCVFTINVILERNSSNDIPEIERAVRLYNGVPQKLVRNNFNRLTYLFFRIDKRGNPIEISLVN